MKYILIGFLLLPFLSGAQSKTDIVRWQETSKRVNIIRDKWGIPHIYGKSDADCVFGLLYAQCEDDFQRVEMNYITMLGRTSEINGEQNIYEDLLVKMVIDSAASVKDYENSPDWMKKLLDAFADGVNYYLYKNPKVKPALLREFKPWYPLTYTDGSISAIQTSDLTANDIKKFYAGLSSDLASLKKKDPEQLSGSNGFAIAPSRSLSGNAMLYIYEETIVKNKDGLFYQHEKQLRPISIQPTTIAYKTANGSMAKKEFKVYATHHGPVMAMQEDKWISMQSNNRSLKGLIQSWSRTKAKSFAEFKSIMDLRENVSNNTVYADDQGNIAYWHGNFMPKRDANMDWNNPVDGSIAATDWKGLHTVDETVHLYNPANGWLQNCNATPFTVAGNGSISKKKYPSYMAPDPENFRGINAVRVLGSREKYDINSLIAAGYDTHLAAFDVLLPSLISANRTAIADDIKPDINKAIQLLNAWDRNSSANSVATTIAIHWAERILPYLTRGKKGDIDLPFELPRMLKEMPDATKISFLIETLKKLKADHGTWEIAWGEVNRFQRISNAMKSRFDDNQPSIPSPFASSAWGSLPSFNSRTSEGSKKRYGYGGNSFICAVEFGKRIKAKSLLAGGESGDPGSKHFKDQADMYTKGQFKDVLFYKEDVLKNMEKQYMPGQ